MTTVTCPNCHSKFRFSQEGLAKSTIKMRCSVCAHVFTHTTEAETTLDEEFNSLLSSNTGQDVSQPASEHESFTEEISQEIMETPADEPPGDQEKMPEGGEELHPESVMREIDSILGAGSEVAEEAPPELQETRHVSVFTVALAIIAILGVIMAALWYFQDKIPFIERSRHKDAQAVLERGPFFTIAKDSLTYEILTHEKEGSVLVIRGNIRKITPKSVDSILVEARVYDKAGKQLESRLAYAGIVPDTSEFTRQAGKDIDALLTSQPAASGSAIPSSDIPFAVAFFGKSAQEGASFQIEVKEFRWK